jgi:hypothetical protein
MFLYSDHHHPRPHRRLSTVLGILVAALLGLVLPKADPADALSIGGQLTSKLVPTPEGPFLFGFEETFSCLPGFGCGDVTSRYAIRGTSESAIPAQFTYGQGGLLGGSGYSVFFQATDLNGRLLARIRTGVFGDLSTIEATTCGPIPGECVSFVPPNTHNVGMLPGDFDPTLPRFPLVSTDEFIARAPDVVLTNEFGLLPFQLPVGPRTGIQAQLQLELFNSTEGTSCHVSPSDCDAHMIAGYTLTALPPPGASFLEPVPEPATLLLVGTTAAGLGLVRWRQRRRKQREVVVDT